MKRWLFHIFTLLSLVLFIGVAVLWIKSVTSLADSFGYGWYDPGTSTFHRREIGSFHGCISFGGNDYFYDRTKTLLEGKRLPPPETWDAGWFWYDDMAPDFPPWGPSPTPSLRLRLGFDWYRIPHKLALDTRTTWGLVLPDWFLMLLLLILPAQWLRGLPAHRRRLRLQRGLCPVCGYDLRAHLAGGAGDKCPECGTLISTRNPA